MGTTRHAVRDRDPPTAAVAALKDFRLASGSEAPAELGLAPGWSLYALELDEPRSAVFVRLDRQLDLSGPFLVDQQRDGARDVLVVPMDAFFGLADGLEAPVDLAFLFSTGRCGSTLASRMLASLPRVLSVSEPDVYSNLVEARSMLGHDEAVKLIRAATVVLCHGLGASHADHVVVKPRSEPVLQRGAYAAAFPGARHVFMYRGVVGYSRSVARYARRLLGEVPRAPVQELLDPWNQLTAFEPLTTLGRMVDLERADIGLHELFPAAWALRIEAHLAAGRRGGVGGATEAIHYDDLVADREHETARLLAGCGLDGHLAGSVLSVFERDAHEGMPGANDIRVRELDHDELDEILRQLPRLGVPPLEVERL